MLPFIVLLILQVLGLTGARPALRPAGQSVPQCRDVTLGAAYFAEEKPGEGAGFLLELRNNRATPIVLPDPVPLSVHWYAFSAGRWSWRSSSGSGGALVDAGRPHGAVFAAPPAAISPASRTVAPHSMYSWTALMSVMPSLQYRPGCEHCDYQGENRFQAVLAYAFLPPKAGMQDHALLGCGLRSSPVVMPPLARDQNLHNSGRPDGF